MKLAFVDTETTHLDSAIGEAYEFAVAINDGPVRQLYVPHTLRNADPQALEVGGYWDRGFRPFDRPGFSQLWLEIITSLRGAVLVGSNPAFDQDFMTRRIFGTKVWHHRMIDVAQGAMWVFGWDEPRGLADVVAELAKRGHRIPEPDHTAVGDVEATRAAYTALVLERNRIA